MSDGRAPGFSYRPSGTPLACGGGAHGRPGSLDERARRLSHEELAVAARHVADGHDVRAIADSRTGGRSADLAVCSTTVEVKAFRSAADRPGGRPSAFSVYNKLVDASGQAPHAVIYGVGSGLTEQTARRGVARYASAPSDRPKLDHIRIMGDGFDLQYSRHQERLVSVGAEPRQRRPGLAL